MNMISKVQADDSVAEPVRTRPRWRRGLLVLLPLAAVGGGAAWALRDPAPVAPPPPPTVTVAVPLVREIAEWDEYIGRFEASRTVEVRPRVSGAVTAVMFTDGAFVRQGELLFTIDARPLAAALAEARAGVDTASSELALARADLGRATRLLEVDGVSRSEIDQLRARVRSSQAALAAAQARVRSRALDVEFTRVRAPISGRVSDRKVDAGNLVSAGEGGAASLLTTINAVDPIYFSFEGSEALFLKMKRATASGGSNSLVEVRLQDETDYRWRGQLDFTDNAIDPRSGTIRGRAVIRNAGAFLTPGMFGNMRLSAGGTKSALLVPDAAVQTDQARKLVPVLAANGTINLKPVQLGPVVDGLRVVRAGLAPTDRVVIQGAQLAMPGMKVGARNGRIAPVAAPPQASIAAPTGGQVTLTR